ncbi:hypothetical protein DTO164E3_8028 [Paecilomyces variotii]|nr:hypothetical protein DTO164E3_8028 [Paecilomyces variotii]KAJ9348528.1 hypothetical protein DTO027B9_8264 [Paecilomyces variotii]
MAFRSRPNDFDARFLRRLVGTKVTTFDDLDPQRPSAPSAVSRSWIITEKLGERASYLSQEDIDRVVGSPMTVGKFLCHLEEDPTQIAFMRIYYQIPYTGTEDADLATLAQQVKPPQPRGELEAFRLLMRQGCSSVPRFLGYCRRTQEEHELVPGGFVEYLVWQKVPGEPLTQEYFWSLDPHVREDIRAKFRVAFEEMLRCGVKPQSSRTSKIIYDKSTGNVRISGFRGVWPSVGKLQWSDNLYVAYGLARPRENGEWRDLPEKWEF